MIRQTEGVHHLRLPRNIVAASLAGSVLLGACGFGGSDSEDLTPLPTSATTTVTPTMAPLTTTTTAPTTTTSPATTTTVVDPIAELVLRRDGIGDVRFGVDPEAVVNYLKSQLGSPSQDSGYVDSFSEFGSCPGTRVRGVRWGDLTLLFGDESTVAEGRLHFFAWKYGPSSSGRPVPPGLVAEGGITLGSTVSAIVKAFPQTQIFTDEIFGAGFEIVRTLSGTLTDSGPSGRVTVLYGGISCGG